MPDKESRQGEGRDYPAEKKATERKRSGLICLGRVNHDFVRVKPPFDAFKPDGISDMPLQTSVQNRLPSILQILDRNRIAETNIHRFGTRLRDSFFWFVRLDEQRAAQEVIERQ
jgi:hypothetical protein